MSDGTCKTKASIMTRITFPGITPFHATAKAMGACLILAGGLSACQSNNQGDRAIAGGLIGAGTGAVVGGLATGRAGGALAGAAIGGAGGAIIGASTAPQRSYRSRSCTGYDEYGNAVRVAC